MLNPDEILKFINSYEASQKYRFAAAGQRYYEGDHDIKNYKLFYIGKDGKAVEDKNRSNIKICHPFFTELTDQEVQYMLSGHDFFKSDDQELQKRLDEYFNQNDSFVAELYDVLTGAISKGFEYMYAYMNSDGKLAFQCADSLGVVEAEGKYTSDGRSYYIYWYTERINLDDKRVKRIQVWDDAQTWYYTQIEDGKIELDQATDGRINPRPHVLYHKANDDNTYYEGFGFIPFFRLDNGRKQFSGLRPIKELIDDYDLMSCGLSNNIQDASEYLVVVRGFEGNDLEELINNTKVMKHIGVPGGEGNGVDFKTVDIPYEARKEKLELDEKNIYRAGMGFNASQVGDGNVTNIVIQSRYSLLDMKCNKLQIRLEQFLRKILKVVLEEINSEHGTDYRQTDVVFDFDRETMTNKEENANIDKMEADTVLVEVQTILSAATQLDAYTVTECLCDTLDLDFETIRGRLNLEDPGRSILDARQLLEPDEQ